MKTVGRKYFLPQNEYNQRVEYQNVFELCEEIVLKFRRLKKNTQTVGLSIPGSEDYHKRATVTTYLNPGYNLFRVCKLFFDSWHVPMVGMISVWVANLKNAFHTPAFLSENTEKKEVEQKAKDTINDKFSGYTIRNEFLLYSKKFTPVSNEFMADAYERFKLVASG